MRKYSYTTILLLTTFIYGIHMMMGYTFLRILEPPMRTVVIIGMLLLPLLSGVFIKLKKVKALQWSIITITSVWIMVATMYILHPLPNGGWVLAGGLALYALNILGRGDWRV